MTDLPVARSVRRQSGGVSAATVSLTYDARMLRRKRLVAEDGMAFLVDLPQTVSLDDGDAFELETGALVAVSAAPEQLYSVTAPDLARIAWHIGNRHAPAQIGPGHLLIQRDLVLRRMLDGLGADVAEVILPFTPEGGAYGHGRTMGHSHGGHSHGGHDHGDHDHGDHDEHSHAHHAPHGHAHDP